VSRFQVTHLRDQAGFQQQLDKSVFRSLVARSAAVVIFLDAFPQVGDLLVSWPAIPASASAASPNRQVFRDCAIFS